MARARLVPATSSCSSSRPKARAISLLGRFMLMTRSMARARSLHSITLALGLLGLGGLGLGYV